MTYDIRRDLKQINRDSYEQARLAYHAAPIGSPEEWAAMKAMMEALFAAEDARFERKYG